MEWQPIEKAPKDERILLYFPEFHGPGKEPRYIMGHWADNRFAAKPRPYWCHDEERLWGTVQCRNKQPTHWLRPEPPK